MPLRPALLALLLSGAGLPLVAQQPLPPLVSDRPDFTESALTVPRGMIQVEGGVTSAWGGGPRSVTAGEVLIRVGAGERTELRLGLPSYLSVRTTPAQSGLDDLFAGAKIALSTHPARPVALLLGATLPTGSRSVASHTFQPEAVLATSFDLADGVGFGVNAGVARPDDGEPFTQVFGSATIALGLWDRVGAYAEVYAFDRTAPGGDGAPYANAGLTVAVTPALQLDARLGTGLGRVSTERFWGMGIVRRF